MPIYIPGGDFQRRLLRAQAAPMLPKLPGGHHYGNIQFAFVPIEQRSIEAKVHYIGKMFGWYDVVCANTKYELAKTRAQMLADGYTMSELLHRAKEHHCG